MQNFINLKKLTKEMIHQYTNNQIDEYLKIANSKGIIWPFSNLNNSIKGLEINKLKEINVPKGNVLKFLDKKDKSFKEFGECYLSCIKFNAIKGWKRHKKAT